MLLIVGFWATISKMLTLENTELGGFSGEAAVSLIFQSSVSYER